MTQRAQRTALGRVAMVVLALVLLAALWELYKAVAPADGVHLGSSSILIGFSCSIRVPDVRTDCSPPRVDSSCLRD